MSGSGLSRLTGGGEGSFEAENASGSAAAGNLSLASLDPGNMAPSVSPATGSALSNGPSFTSPLAELNQKVEEIYDIPMGK